MYTHRSRKRPGTLVDPSRKLRGSMSEIDVIWLKRDLRTLDHGPISAARPAQTLVIYVYELGVTESYDWSDRHQSFAEASLAEVSKRLEALGIPLIIARGEIIEIFSHVLNQLQNQNMSLVRLLSHQETGNLWSYRRDQRVKEWCRSHKVEWIEFLQNAVFRGQKRGEDWAKRREKFISTPLYTVPPKSIPSNNKLESIVQRIIEDSRFFKQSKLILSTQHTIYELPGETEALKRLESFLDRRGKDYRFEMSSPMTAEESCSRVSAALAFGNISTRFVYKKTLQKMRTLSPQSNHHRSLESFLSRLAWRCHFIQKLETEPTLEDIEFNRAYAGMRAEDEETEKRLLAWDKGNTGVPMIDACMRYLNHTGWINFRMRAMLQSFASYQLWLPWHKTGRLLARKFLDYEPGIHWSQVQMQSGVTGINIPRIYCPIKQGHDQDEDGLFVKKWIPELRDVPNQFVHSPWKLSPLELAMFHLSSDSIYTNPIVDVEKSRRITLEKYTKFYNSPKVRAEAMRVYMKHGSRKKRT